MCMSDNDDKKRLLNQDSDSGDSGDTGESGKGGKGGKRGEVEFKAFISLGEKGRDDLLPPDEKRRLLSTHKDTHELRVKKQKDLIDKRHAVKEGKMPLQEYRDGLRANNPASQYKTNPVLANKAQFSGMDRQVNSLPNENLADTNNAKRDELTYQYQLRYQPENAPKFNPRPQYR